MVAGADARAGCGSSSQRDPMMWVSHETIYQALYVQGRGELRRELARCLRTGRAKRRAQGRGGRGSPIKDMVMISERPAEADDRAVPGHWEGDLIIGKNGKSAVGTLVERTTRYVLLLHLPGDHDRRDRCATPCATRSPRCPTALRRSLTWDQGIEMAEHAELHRRHRPRRSTSATRTAPGSAAPTRTPTACSASTCPKAPTSPCTPPPTSTHVAGQPQQPPSQDPRMDDTIGKTPGCEPVIMDSRENHDQPQVTARSRELLPAIRRARTSASSSTGAGPGRAGAASGFGEADRVRRDRRERPRHGDRERDTRLPRKTAPRSTHS